MALEDDQQVERLAYCTFFVDYYHHLWQLFLDILCNKVSLRLIKRQMGLMQTLQEVNSVVAPEVSSSQSQVDLTTFKAENEPMLEYLKDSAERKRVQASLTRLQSQMTEIPIIVGDQEKRTRDFRFQVKVGIAA